MYKTFFSLQFRREETVCATAPWSQKNLCGSPSKPRQGLTMLCLEASSKSTASFCSLFNSLCSEEFLIQDFNPAFVKYILCRKLCSRHEEKKKKDIIFFYYMLFLLFGDRKLRCRRNLKFVQNHIGNQIFDVLIQ